MEEWKNYSCVCDNEYKTRGECLDCTKQSERMDRERDKHLAHISRVRSVMKSTGMSSYELLNNNVIVK